VARRTGQTFEVTAANRQLARFEALLARAPVQVRKAAAGALRRSVRSGASFASREIRKDIRLSKKAVDERITGRIVSQRALIGSVAVRDRRIELVEFMSAAQIATQQRRQRARSRTPLSVRAYKTKPRQQYPGAFVAKGKRSGRWHVLKRQGPARYPAFIQYGPNLIAQYVKALPRVAEQQAVALQKTLNQALERVAARL